MNLPTSAIILGTLVVATTAIAYIGDTVGKRVGKRRVSLFGLRPRHTGVLISVLTGVLILATAVLVMSISSERVRIALFGMEKLRRDESRLRSESRHLNEEAATLRKQRKALESKVAERGAEVATLETQVKDLQTHLGTTESSLKASETRLKTQNKAVADARSMLGDVRGLLTAEKDRLKKIEERLEEKRRELVKANEQVEKVGDVAMRAGADVVRLDADVLALEREKARLEQDVKQLEDFAKPLFEIAKRAREGEVIYEANQVLGAEVIDGEQTEAAIRQQLLSLLNGVGREALKKGARPDKEGERAVQLATKRTGTAESPVYYHDSDLLDLVAKDIHQSGDSVVVELWALRNYVAGEQVGSDFVLFPNRLCFHAGDTLVTRKLDPSGDPDAAARKAGLFRDILAALQEVRKVARAKGMRADESGQFGEVGYEQIFALLDRVLAGKRALTFHIVAAAEAWTAGPVKIRFEVEGPASP